MTAPVPLFHQPIVNHTALRNEIMAVARGEKRAPDYAGKQTFESMEALIRDRKPGSTTRPE